MTGGAAGAGRNETADLPGPSAGVTPAWLTAALRRAGTLPRGQVVAAAEQANAAFNSRTTHLTLTYAPGAPPDAPERLLLKRSLPVAWARDAGQREVRFYEAVASLPDHPPLTVPCYTAGHDPLDDSWYVLLLDLSASHRPAMTRERSLDSGANVPEIDVVRRVVDTLARLHAYWWEHPRLGRGQDAVGPPWPHFRDAAGFGRFAQRAATSWATLVRDHGERLPAPVRATVEWAVPRLPRLWDRHLATRVPAGVGVTLTHGDAYFANFLCPRAAPSLEGVLPDGAGGAGAAGGARTYLIDWQSPAVQVGAEDLANLCATFWTPAQRAEGQREQRILRHYHDGLCANGVRDYPWEQLQTDYRGAVITWLTVPLQDAADGSGPDYWVPKLGCLAGAFEDLGCAALLGP